MATGKLTTDEQLKPLVEVLGNASDGSGTARQPVSEFFAPVTAAVASAQAYAGQAQTWATAVSDARRIVADTAAGLAATSEGELFEVPSSVSAGYTDLYRHDAGPAATYLKTFPSADLVTGLEGSVNGLLTTSVETAGRTQIVASQLAPLLGFAGLRVDQLPTPLADSDGVLCAAVVIAADGSLLYRLRTDGQIRSYVTEEA